LHLLKLLPRNAHGQTLPAPEKLQKKKRLAAASRRDIFKSNKQEFNALVCLDPDPACWMPATIGADSNVCRCSAIHSEARHNYFHSDTSVPFHPWHETLFTSTNCRQKHSSKATFGSKWCSRPELNWDPRFRKQFTLLHDGKQKTIANIGHS
jgi:hypothetical protein